MTIRETRAAIAGVKQVSLYIVCGKFGMWVRITKGEARSILAQITEHYGRKAQPADIGCTAFGCVQGNTLHLGGV